MPNAYTSAGRRNLLATSAPEPFLVLLEIRHFELSEPVRAVNDTVNIVSRGHEYVACPFDLVLPDDVSGQVAKSQLRVDNIGRELTQWLEYSRGAKGATCRIIQALRSDPDVFEYDAVLDMTNVVIDNTTVTADLGYQNTLLLSAVALRYDPKTAPGVF